MRRVGYRDTFPDTGFRKENKKNGVIFTIE